MKEKLANKQTVQEERRRAALVAIGNEVVKELFGENAYADAAGQETLEGLGHAVYELGLRFVRYQKGA